MNCVKRMKPIFFSRIEFTKVRLIVKYVYKKYAQIEKK